MAVTSSYNIGKAAALGAMLMTGGPAVGSRTATRGSSRTSVVVNKRRKKAHAGSFKAQMLRNIDTHHCTLSDANYFVAGTHNTMYTANITAVPVQGTTNATRIGDRIHIQNLVVSMAANSAAAAGAYMWRILVLWSGEENTPAGLAAGLGFTEVFLPTTGGGLTALAITNPKAVTVLLDELVDINSLVATTKDVYSVRRTISIGADYAYQAAGSTYGKTKNLYVVVVGSVIGGVSGTTAVGDFNFNCDMTFKPI